VITLIEDKEFPNLRMAVRVFDGGYCDQCEDTSFLRKVYFVKKDRTVIEVLTKADGYFDYRCNKTKIVLKYVYVSIIYNQNTNGKDSNNFKISLYNIVHHFLFDLLLFYA
jgi:hypothetical protein